MDQVLYRKYRPSKFSQVRGQDHIIEILKQSVLNQELSHAYLFSGPRGTGKTTVARLLAKAVNCLNFESEKDVCNECENCKSASLGSCVDIIEMDAASNRGIEEIRSLKDGINFVPTVLKRKIYIIDEAHMLTKEAFNALLKTLEEPPDHVLFILATTEAHKLPITILSRVQRYDFKLANQQDMITKLEQIVSGEEVDLDSEVLDLIYSQSGGSYRDAESLLGKVILLAKSQDEEGGIDVRKALGVLSEVELDSILAVIMSKSFNKISSTLQEISQKGVDVGFLVDQLLTRIKEKIVHGDEATLKDMKENISLVRTLVEAKKELRYFSDKLTLLEIAFLKFCFETKKDGTTSLNQEGGGRNKLDENSDAKDPRPGNNSEEIPEKVKKKANTKSLKDEAETKKKDTLPGLDSVKLVESVGNLGANSRLKAVLRTSDIITRSEGVIIRNRYKFNVDYLSRAEVKSLINEALKLDGDKVEVIGFEKIEDDEMPYYGGVEGSAVTLKDSSGEVNYAATGQNALAESEVDNSELVESIL